MLYSIKDKIRRFFFQRICRKVLATAPLRMDKDSDTAVLTLLQHKDVFMFLIAVKSFSRQIPIGDVYILNDGTLTSRDKTILSSHIEQVEFIELNEIANEHCPRGSCWERLFAIAERAREQYIVQIDSDTVTLGAIPEVRELIKKNHSFVIGTWDNQTIEPMQISSERIRKNVNPTADGHVQMVAEQAFEGLSDCRDLKYVRGCAGFSGFAKGSIDKDFIERISTEMETLIGNKWHDWGSEQVMSNIVVANTPDAAVLPHPKYCDCTKINATETQFIHYVGSCRFTTQHYATTVAKTITSLGCKV